MALLEQCFCCSLAVASSVIGVYTLIAYVIAFSMEMWWILQTEASLPSLAYMLCSVYLLIFITSGFLLRGLSIRKTLYLFGWLIAICILSFPEAGLVLFMSIYYWKVRSLYGLTELTCWICRVVVNIAGVICIQSLYSTWREEKHVVRSLQGLHMKSLERPSNGNGDLKAGRLGYQNAGFSSPVTNNRNSFKVKHIAAPNLKRSASSASQYSIISRINSQQHGGSLPYGINTIDQQSRPVSPFVNDAPFLEQEFKSPSEFNASNFDLVLSSAIRNPNHAIPNAPLNRTQSMLNITGSLSDLVPRKAMSVVDYPLPTAASTQSLDRRLIRQSQPVMAGPGYFAAGDGRIRNAYFSNGVKKYNPRGSSIGVLYPMNMDYRYPNLYPYNIMNATAFYPRKPKSGSRMSLGNESDDFQKYRDVAL